MSDRGPVDPKPKPPPLAAPPSAPPRETVNAAFLRYRYAHKHDWQCLIIDTGTILPRRVTEGSVGVVIAEAVSPEQARKIVAALNAAEQGGTQ